MLRLKPESRIKRLGPNGYKQSYYTYVCDCGVRFAVFSSYRVSCDGCEKRTRKLNRRNRSAGSAYLSWVAMKDRCNNPRNKRYSYYGGRGIRVCERWDKFKNFLADMGERPPNMTIERINNDKGYYKGNCRWATRSEQERNKRKKRLTRCLIV